MEKTMSLNTESTSFKHLTVKQVFPREPYRMKIHKHVQYVPKPPTSNGFGDWKPPASYQISHKMTLDKEELARRSAIYASLADSMVQSIIAELSPKDERSKLLREKLAIIQEMQVAAVSAGFATSSNLQLLQQDSLLQNFGFQLQVLNTVRTAPFEGSHVLGAEPKVLPTVGSDHPAGGPYGRVFCDLHPENQRLSTVQHQEDCYSQEDPASQSSSV